jgi:two-component system cell cycle response regulator DivK
MSALILIIEDNPLNAKLARDVLSAKGYEVLVAETAELGLELAASRVPALILMDIQLPGMDGISALRELRKSEALASVPVLAVTASAMPMERKEILAAGFDGYQAKPISVKALLGEIEKLLGGRDHE